MLFLIATYWLDMPIGAFLSFYVLAHTERFLNLDMVVGFFGEGEKTDFSKISVWTWPKRLKIGLGRMPWCIQEAELQVH